MKVQAKNVVAPSDGDQDRDEIAVIVPVYMCKGALRELCRRLVVTLENITDRFSIVLVDDRSHDNAWPLICEIGKDETRIRGIQLSRNFGQHRAITAGIDHARANWYVVMDGDLQDAPEDIALLYSKALEGFDTVVGRRTKAAHGFIKRQSSKLFYGVFNKLTGVKLGWEFGNFRIFSDAIADGYRQMREQMRFLPASLSLMGFDVGEVELGHHPRHEGKSSYTFTMLLRLAGETILSHSNLPLRWAAMLGLLISTTAVFAAAFLIARKLLWDTAATGWTSLIVAIFVIGGMQIFITGVVGIYVGKCFEEAKRRPLYFIKATSNF